jgi:hypothetical protein
MNGNLIAQQLREIIEKWDCMKVNRFWAAMETVARLKRQCTEWEKSFPAIYLTWD